mgnify:CR=1 FL=1
MSDLPDPMMPPPCPDPNSRTTAALIAWARGYAGQQIAVERQRCADLLAVTRSDASLAAGEMTAAEWRTCSAVLAWLQRRMRAGRE